MDVMRFAPGDGFGTTANGGKYNSGIAFEIVPSWFQRHRSLVARSLMAQARSTCHLA
jgi:hypothetical protein